MRLKLQPPDYTQLCRRQAKYISAFDSPECPRDCNRSLHLVVDSTGLKVIGVRPPRRLLSHQKIETRIKAGCRNRFAQLGLPKVEINNPNYHAATPLAYQKKAQKGYLLFSSFFLERREKRLGKELIKNKNLEKFADFQFYDKIIFVFILKKNNFSPAL